MPLQGQIIYQLRDSKRITLIFNTQQRLKPDNRFYLSGKIHTISGRHNAGASIQKETPDQLRSSDREYHKIYILHDKPNGYQCFAC